jgi:hypothetical protein
MSYYYRHGVASLAILCLLLVLVNPMFTLGIFLFGAVAVRGYSYIPPEHPQLAERDLRGPLKKQPKKPIDDPEATMYIPELDQKFRPCCYQSARLSDKYCPCGRAVDPELIEVVASYREIEEY